MSGFITPLIVAPLVLSNVVNYAGTVLWYTAGGVWWLGKRAIYGYQPTPEEVMIEEQRRLSNRVEEQEKLIRKQSELLEKIIQK
jgi:uncharacterized membrane protein YfbV (UPF0208 family)